MTFEEMKQAAYSAGDYDKAALYQALIDLENENADQVERIQDQDQYIQSLVREIELLMDQLKGNEQ